MNEINDNSVKCPVKHTLDVVGGKWKARILALLQFRSLRTGELKRALGKITDKVLSDQLKELLADGLINRYDHKQIPPKVEYSLTEKGETLLPLINLMFDWGAEDMKRTGELPENWTRECYAKRIMEME